MHVTATMMVLLIGLGFLAGFIDSAVGGGGLISLPALMFSGLPPAAAVGTNKIIGAAGSFTSTLIFRRSGKINVKLLRYLMPFTVAGALLGAWAVTQISPNVLKPLMLILLAAVLVYTIWHRNWGAKSTFKQLTGWHWVGFAVVIGALGFYDGFIGPGVGSFLIFAFLSLGFDFLGAAGNAKLLNLTSNVVSLTLFIILGHVHFLIGLPMGIASVVGSFLGARITLKMGTQFIRVIFIGMTLILLLKNTWDYFH